jgi:hypothetical protein
VSALCADVAVRSFTVRNGVRAQLRNIHAVALSAAATSKSQVDGAFVDAVWSAMEVVEVGCFPAALGFADLKLWVAKPVELSVPVTCAYRLRTRCASRTCHRGCRP